MQSITEPWVSLMIVNVNSSGYLWECPLNYLNLYFVELPIDLRYLLNFSMSSG